MIRQDDDSSARREAERVRRAREWESARAELRPEAIRRRVDEDMEMLSRYRIHEADDRRDDPQRGPSATDWWLLGLVAAMAILLIVAGAT